ncbi:hypothetical protein VTI74DRAFT_1469 [Chaetomium olivicolor]
MRISGNRGEDSWTSFIQRRGLPDPTRFDLDLTRTRADSGGVAGLRSYPSPPMSGSPPLSLKTSQEVAERSQGRYQATTQDVDSAIPTTQSGERTSIGLGSAPRPSFSGPADRPSYTFPQHEDSAASARPPPYPRQFSHATAQPAAYLPHPGIATASGQPGPLPAPQAYPAATHHSIPESIQLAPPKPQRKTKGHVASACVPCKKAHLRCDAERPCSRCISTNKEGSCVDVQHKKRGRPRLRDDNQAKYDTRFGGGAEAMRRPLSSAYGPVSSLGMVYDDPLRRTQSYRVLKSQPVESLAPRFPERGLASDANIYPAPLSITTGRVLEEPVAFLTIGLEFSRVSASFLSTVGRASVSGLKLVNVLVAEERTKASTLQQQAQEEQTRKEPTYLPPIFNDRSETVMQSLGFTPEEVSRYPLPWVDTLTFLGDDGQGRRLPIRAGLATRNSIYFVVLLLNRTPRSSYPTPSPRDLGASSYDPALQPYPTQPTPLSATFDTRQSRLSDPGYDPRQAGPSSGPLHMLTGRGPGLPPAFGASSSRPDYPITPRTYQTPRSELQSTGRPPPPEYQLLPLPRIRTPPGGTSQQFEATPPHQQQQHQSQPQQGPYLTRDERPRLGIGGLLEKPGPKKDL